MAERTEVPINRLLPGVELSKLKYYCWLKRLGTALSHIGQIPKIHWLTPDKVKAVIGYAKKHCYK